MEKNYYRAKSIYLSLLMKGREKEGGKKQTRNILQ
jgi:hypothetical protein